MFGLRLFIFDKNKNNIENNIASSFEIKYACQRLPITNTFSQKHIMEKYVANVGKHLLSISAKAHIFPYT